MMASKVEGSARDRLLAAANELFYEEGVHTVGIDRVIERAGVAKASLYSTFGSKEELVRAYLQGRAEARRQRVLLQVAKHAAPRDRLLAIFDALGDAIASPSYRGCAFVNASAEGPRGETKVTQVCADTRAWLRALLTDLARELGAAAPAALARQLHLLYDGAAVSAAMDHQPDTAAVARSIAATLLDDAAPPEPTAAKSAATAKPASLVGKSAVTTAKRRAAKAT
ncbi:MAG TPA: helix-turn-helix domain-containing protein [Kofleriaceae bacterium]|nr:helix-turn-helix domain-containing protein [Kofleriaceae bacterium]